MKIKRFDELVKFGKRPTEEEVIKGEESLQKLAKSNAPTIDKELIDQVITNLKKSKDYKKELELLNNKYA